MNGRTILRLAPRIIKQYKSNKLLENRIYLCTTNSYAVNRFTNLIQTRGLIQDASKHEIAEGRERLYYGILTPHIRAVKTEFTPEDVKIPEVPGMFTTFVAKGKAMFLEPRFFNDPSHYAKIMGYDKPMDFKMFADASQDKK
ncbi:hypothetical protein MML48_1g15751 [Holotrichia oblita]|uniref:Uncharacterized protein n=1 Tax=Holotrichia oblita TaxID=644536 RepID=A0ACB9TYU8_HOLOL|nr:hypothetical protein MML48_1g15751 [Holotrichia oblita]